ncbi:MAG: hypothetical protein V1792_00940 [Pseudomonadota bacterium]
MGTFRVLAEQPSSGFTVQLVEDSGGGYHLRKVSEDDGTIFSIVPVHGDPSVLAEARELFPDILPFGAMPVDAT